MSGAFSGKNKGHLLHTDSPSPTNKLQHKHNLKKNPAIANLLFCSDIPESGIGN